MSFKTVFSAIKVGEFYELTTPYMDRNNDCLQFYVKENSDGTFILTDDGFILANLRFSGISFSDSTKRHHTLEKIIRKFGVTVNGDCLVTEATETDYPQKEYMLIQSMLAIDNLAE